MGLLCIVCLFFYREIYSSHYLTDHGRSKVFNGDGLDGVGELELEDAGEEV